MVSAGVYFTAFSSVRMPCDPACTPSQNISVNPTRIEIIVPIDNTGTNRKNAPMLARNITPAKVRRNCIVMTSERAGGMPIVRPMSQREKG